MITNVAASIRARHCGREIALINANVTLGPEVLSGVFALLQKRCADMRRRYVDS